jgi:phenylalanine-4-hydroxylase
VAKEANPCWARTLGGTRGVKTILSEANEWEPKTFCIVETAKDEPGSLRRILDCFEEHNINLNHLESRMQSFARTGPSFHIDFESQPEDEATLQFMQRLNSVKGVIGMEIQPVREVPWFPLNIRDLDLTRETLDGGTDLINDDHPGFHDQDYKKRRSSIVEIAHTYTHGTEIPRIKYTDEETKTWGAVYDKLSDCHKQWACSEYTKVIPQMEKYCGYAPNNIPQLADISDFLMQSSGFSLRPISGLLSARDFLNALAFRVFFSTQYIRHSGNPFYTPEPDICHELLGHAPLFANMDFADFSQEIGLASLAASDDDINRLATVYWFTVEFGLLQEDGDIKAYGAGLLSSFGEMEWSCSGSPSQEAREMGSVPHLQKPDIQPFDPFVTCKTEYPITTYQPTYFCATSMADAKQKMDVFCDSLSRPFFPQYDSLTQSIRVTKAVKRAPRTSTVQLQAEKQKAFFDAQA